MAGLGSRFQKSGFKNPKPFIKIKDKTMIELVLDNINVKDAFFYLIARKEHIEAEYILASKIEKKYNAKFILIDNLTEGSACTVLHSRKFINNNIPLLIANSDQLVDISISDFINDCINKKLDGSILCFEDNEMNPKWSFAKVDKNGFVIEVKEKIPISNFATVGIYFFTKGSDYVNYTIDMIIKNDRVNNEFYTCPVYNYMIKDSKRIGYYLLRKNNMHGLGTPEDYFLYLKKLNEK